MMLGFCPQHCIMGECVLSESKKEASYAKKKAADWD